MTVTLGIYVLACIAIISLFWVWGYRAGISDERLLHRASLEHALESRDRYWNMLGEAQFALVVVKSPTTSHQEAREVAATALSVIRSQRSPSPSEGEG